MLSFRKVIALAAIATVSATQAVHAHAERELIRSVRVGYSALNLQRDADAHILLMRIEDAARRACGGNPHFHPAYDRMPQRVIQVFSDCREEAVARAAADVGPP